MWLRSRWVRYVLFAAAMAVAVVILQQQSHFLAAYHLQEMSKQREELDRIARMLREKKALEKEIERSPNPERLRAFLEQQRREALQRDPSPPDSSNIGWIDVVTGKMDVTPLLKILVLLGAMISLVVAGITFLRATDDSRAKNAFAMMSYLGTFLVGELFGR